MSGKKTQAVQAMLREVMEQHIAFNKHLGLRVESFDIEAPKPLSGAYLRLWNRDAAGRWWLMVDVAQPFRP